jgi:hypothetical protein
MSSCQAALRDLRCLINQSVKSIDDKLKQQRKQLWNYIPKFRKDTDSPDHLWIDCTYLTNPETDGNASPCGGMLCSPCICSVIII